MKKPFIVIGAVLVLSLTGRAGAATLRIDPATQDVMIGSNVNVGVAISGLGDGAPPSLSTFDLDVTFGQDILSFVGFTFGDPILGDQLDLSGVGSIRGISTGAGTANLFELSLDNAADLTAFQASSFTLGTLRFNALSGGEGTIGISVNAAGDANGDPLTAETLGGRVVVNAVSVPEPASFLLLLGGSTGLAVWRVGALRRRSARG
jgi:hypothetical protein